VDDDLTTADAPARIEVVGGGRVTAEHLAALAVALTPTVGDGADHDRQPSGPPAWARAALVEGVGLPRPTRPSDLSRITVLG
jgi:hypothetical protein